MDFWQAVVTPHGQRLGRPSDIVVDDLVVFADNVDAEFGRFRY